jgi:hypothetical protein
MSMPVTQVFSYIYKQRKIVSLGYSGSECEILSLIE